MGYTNYWHCAKKCKEFDPHFLEVVNKIIEKSNVPLEGDSEPKSKPIISPTMIIFNGAEPDDYETFVLEANTEYDEFSFCKTARRPYDVVCKAVLLLAMEYGYVKEFDFDGDKTEEEYIAAEKLYLQTLYEMCNK